MFKSSRKKLIAIGCSFTTGGANAKAAKRRSSWPTNLAQKLDMDCVNLGKAGQGNEYISAKLIDTILTEKKEDIGLVVIMWSGWQRLDFQDMEGEWKGVDRTGDVWDSMLKYNNPYNSIMKSLRHFLIAQMLLKDIPYLMTQSIDTIIHSFGKGWIHTFINSKIFDEINEDKFIGWPIMQEIGGYNVENMLDKFDPQFIATET